MNEHLNRKPHEACEECVDTSEDIIDNPTKYGLPEDASFADIRSFLDTIDNGNTCQYLRIGTRGGSRGCFFLPLDKNNDPVCGGWIKK